METNPVTDLFHGMTKTQICTILKTLFPAGLRMESTTLLFRQRSIVERCDYPSRIAWNRHKKAHTSSLDVSGVTLKSTYGSGTALLDFGNGSTRCIVATDDWEVHQDDLGRAYCEYFVTLSSFLGYSVTIPRN